MTNQEKLAAGLPLHHGYKDKEAGKRTKPLVHDPKCFEHEGSWYLLPTISYRNKPKNKKKKR